MSEETIIVLRPFQEEDAPFIYASWRKALWFDDPEHKDENGKKFFSATTRTIKALLAKPDTTVLMACDKVNPSFIVGYSVQDGKRLEFVYVKLQYRQKGIGKLLSKNAESWAEPTTILGKAIVGQKKNKEKDGKEEPRETRS